MNLSVSGKQIDVGEALRQHVAEAMEPAVAKYFESAGDGSIRFSRESYLYCCSIQADALRGILLQAEAGANDVHVALDMALDRVSKRLRRYKRRLRDHNHAATEARTIDAAHCALGAGTRDELRDEDWLEPDPVVIAEIPARLVLQAAGGQSCIWT